MTNEQQELYEQLIKEKNYNYGQEQLIKDVIELGLSEQEVKDFIASWKSEKIIIPEELTTVSKAS